MTNEELGSKSNRRPEPPAGGGRSMSFGMPSDPKRAAEGDAGGDANMRLDVPAMQI